MLHRRVASAVLLVAAVVASSCAPEGGVELIVELRTDFLPACEVAAVEVSVRTADGADPRRTSQPLAASTDVVGGVRVAEFVNLPLGPTTIDAVLRDAAGSLVAQRRTEIELGADAAVTIVFTRDCEGVTCPGTGDPANLTECLSAACVDPACRPGNRAGCGGVGCGSAADCGGAASCATASCQVGVCLLTPDDGACGSGEACHPTAGCSPASAATGVACPAASDADGDGIDAVVDCDDADASVGSSSQRVCTGTCAVGIERCADGVWGECDAPTDCTCTAGEMRITSCARCGQQQQRCLDGLWVDDGACADQGVCTPGTISGDMAEHGFGPCDACVVGTVSCSAECAWEQQCPACPPHNFGAQCDTDSECTGLATCITEGVGIVDDMGYCGMRCMGGEAPCPSGSVCLSPVPIAGLSPSYCAPTCGSATECPDLWACVSAPSRSRACSPICESDTECRAGQSCTTTSGIVRTCTD